MPYRCRVHASMNRRQALIGALSVATIGIAGTSGCERGRPPDSVSPTADPPIRLYPSAAADLFQPGKRFRVETGDVAVSELKPAGMLRMPTGRLVATDPSWLHAGPSPDIGPFTATVAPGAYPVTLALLRGPDLRVAAARLTVRDEPVAGWEMALRPGQDTSTLRPGYFFGVGVDAAVIALFDAAALEAARSLENAGPGAFHVEGADRPLEYPSLAPGANAIAFNTGWGDGDYPVWIGRTGDGAIGCFIVDMLMLAAPSGASGATPWTPPSTASHPPPLPTTNGPTVPPIPFSPEPFSLG